MGESSLQDDIKNATGIIKHTVNKKDKTYFLNFISLSFPYNF